MGAIHWLPGMPIGVSASKFGNLFLAARRSAAGRPDRAGRDSVEADALLGELLSNPPNHTVSAIIVENRLVVCKHSPQFTRTSAVSMTVTPDTTPRTPEDWQSRIYE